MKSIPNYISYLHVNSWIFSPFLDILINFLKSKTDIDFLFLFKIQFKSKEFPITKVVPWFKYFNPIFYLKLFELEKTIFGPIQLFEYF
jgi:hypothetical protein